MKGILLTLAMAALTAVAHAEGPLEERLKFYESLANSGSAEAKVLMAEVYFYGRYLGQPIPIDDEKAFAYAKAAAEQHHADAYRLLSRMTFQGRGTEADPEMSKKLLEASAKLGSVGAMHDMGKLAIHEKDYANAVYWFDRGKQLDHLESIVSLAYMYSTGRGVELDNARAVKLFAQAAAKGDGLAKTTLGHHYEHGLGVEKNSETAEYWYLQAAQEGRMDAVSGLFRVYGETSARGLATSVDVSDLLDLAEKFDFAKLDLGALYMYGAHSIEPDHARALELFEQAYASGTPGASVNLARFFASDTEKKDLERAQSILLEAANKDDLSALNELILAYFHGEYGFEKNYVRALALAKGQFDNTQSVTAHYVAGRILLTGSDAVPIDQEQGLQLLEHAAFFYYPMAIQQLAIVYLRGDAVEADIPKAIELFESGINLYEPRILNSYAWLLATSIDETYRDGDKAVRLIQEAIIMAPDVPAYLDTYAAALAEQGEWRAAVKKQKEAIRLIESEDLKKKFQARLAQYKKKKPHRYDWVTDQSQ